MPVYHKKQIYNVTPVLLNQHPFPITETKINEFMQDALGCEPNLNFYILDFFFKCFFFFIGGWG